MLSIYCSSFYYLIEYSHKSGWEGGNEMEVDLRFSLRDVCALAGVSHQSIRMYEKWDVLPKIAQEGNGYRYYHYPDLQRVIFLRYYASLGVPIKASAALINGA